MTITVRPWMQLAHSPTTPERSSMYVITETGIYPYYAVSKDVLQHAMNFRTSHGPFSGMDDWDEDTTREWIRRELDNDKPLDLYVGGPDGYSFVAELQENYQAVRLSDQKERS